MDSLSLHRYFLLIIVFRNQQEESKAADGSKRCTVIEDGGMDDAVPKQSSNDARQQLQQASRGTVPADAACTQVFRHEIRRERLANSAEYTLIQPVKDEETCDL